MALLLDAGLALAAGRSPSGLLLAVGGLTTTRLCSRMSGSMWAWCSAPSQQTASSIDGSLPGVVVWAERGPGATVRGSR